MQSDPLCSGVVIQTLHHLRTTSPLVHCMTNEVVQTLTANVLLALGASPAMVVDEQEAAQFSAVANALLINVGTLTRERARAMRAAIDSAREAQHPWVLDPVAVGGLTLRSDFAREILALQPAAIRGNGSEILALAGAPGGGCGVDSTDSALIALPAACHLARESGAVVAVTGEVDYITDGERILEVPGGDLMMTRVVGTGCALSAVTAACCALPGARLGNVAAGCRMMARAGELAAARSQGPGSFVPQFLDALWQLDGEVLA
ncbi:hydroxyethylthiazole kinase [Erwinia sp. CPCC 100877]|nr:hydroxyethylthiazole kinase [Erwinia sp. CPCC 100877]